MLGWLCMRVVGAERRGSEALRHGTLLSVVQFITGPKRSIETSWGRKKIFFFLIRDIDGPAMPAASDGILSLRGSEVSLLVPVYTDAAFYAAGLGMRRPETRRHRAWEPGRFAS